VWYTFSTTNSQRVNLTTCASDFNTRLVVYTGSCGALTEFAANDDNGPYCQGCCTYPASLTFISPGTPTTYTVWVGASQPAINLPNSATTLRVLLDIQPAPVNDTCLGALPLTNQVQAVVTNMYYATELGDPTTNSVGPIYRGVWFKVTAAKDQRVNLNTCTSDYNTRLVVYTGTCGALTEFAANDDNGPFCQGCCTYPASLRFTNSSIQTTYYVLVGAAGPALNFPSTATTLRISSDLQDPPTILTGPASQLALVGANMSFSVIATGTPSLFYRWRFNGTNLSDSAHIVGSQTNALSILNVQSNDAGNYQVVITNAVGAVTSQVAILTFTKITPAVTWANPAAITYGLALGPNQLNAAANAPGSFAYIPAVETVLDSGTNLLSAIFTPTDTKLYKSVTNSVSLIVNKAALTVTANNAARLIGQTNPVFTGTISGKVKGDKLSATYSSNATTNSNPGTYPIVPALVDPNDRLANYSVTTNSGVLTINKLTPVVTWNHLSAISYGTAINTNQLNASANVPGAFTYSPASGTVLTAGTNVITGIFTPSDFANYNSVTSSTSLVVLRVELSVTASNATRAYGLGNPAFIGAIVGLQNYDNITADYTSPATVTSSVGNYPILPVLSDPNGRLTNYTVTLNNGSLTITRSSPTLTWATPAPIAYGTDLGAGQLTASAGTGGNYAYSPAAGTVLDAGTNTLTVVFTPADSVNFNGVTGSVSLVVTRAVLTVTANNAARLFGQTNPVFTGTISGKVKGDKLSATYSSSATTNSISGNYPIVPALVDPNDRLANYSVTTNNGVLTINKATPIVTWTNPAALTYATALGAPQLNATASVPGTFAYTPGGGAILNVGTNVLSTIFTPSNAAGYNNVTSTVSLVVTRAPLTVTANNAARAFGLPNPVFTGTILGMRSGDNISATYTSSAVTNSPIGPYPIVVSLLDPSGKLPNYIVTTNNGTLTVIKNTPVLTWISPTAITYGAALGGSQLNASPNVPGSLVYNPASGMVLNSGTNLLSVVFTPTDAAIYNSVTGTVNLVVQRAALSVTASNASRFEGLPNPVFTGTLNGIVNSDNITATYSSSATPASTPGVYPIVPALVDPTARLTNYTVTANNGSLSVSALNDMFANRKIIPGVSNVFLSSNLGATQEAGEPDHAGYPAGHSLWWTWTAPANGTVTIDTIGSSFDTVLAVYTGTSVSNLVLVAGDDESGGNHTSLVIFQADPLVTYHIAVDGYGGEVGNIILKLNEVYGPPVFVSQPQAQTVQAGAAVTMTASVNGSRPFTFQWRKNDVDILGANSVQLNTNTSYVIPRSQTNDSGSYSVMASNLFGVTVSSAATLNVFLRPDNDVYNHAAPLVGLTSHATGNNLYATRDGFEPALFAGRSVWWSWTAPTNGTVVVDTIGSSFDTVLAIYTNNGVTPVLTAADDQSGGNNASKLVFDTVAGVTYRLGVDGSQWANANARTGSIALNLSVLFVPPQITVQPQPQSAELGWSVTYSVAAIGMTPLNYQWRKNGANISDATNASYTIASVPVGAGGNYSVEVINVFGSAISSNAALNIYAAPANDLFANRILVTGFTNTAYGTNVGAAKESGESNHAGNSGGRSVWWTWIAPTNGTVILDTIGSSFDTLLAVYTGNSVSGLTLVAGDDNSGGNLRSRVVFTATAGTTYQIAVDGSYPAGPNGAAFGTIVLNWQQSALFAPIVLVQPQSQAVAVGGSVSLAVAGAGSPPPTYRWLSNGIPLVGKTNATLQLVNVTTNYSASYSVVLSNTAGVTMSAVAQLNVQRALNPGYRSSWPGFKTGSAEDVKVADGLAYVATTAGFLILDVSDPASPRRISSYTSDSAATRIVERDGYVYLLTSSNQISGAKLSRFDVRNPGLPQKVAEFVSTNASDFALTDDLLCAVDGSVLRILNTNCVPVGTLNTANGLAAAIVASNSLAYVSWTNSLRVYSLVNPATPAQIANFSQTPAQLALADGYLYTLTGGQRTVQFRVLDPTNLQKPQVGINVLSNTLGQAAHQSVATGSNTAFVVTAGDTGNALGVYDVSQSGNPQLIGTSLFAEGAPRRITVDDGYAYVANGGAGLKVFDVTDPAHPSPIANFFTSVQVNALALQGNLAFAMDKNTGFHVLDVSNPTDPLSLGSYQSTNGAAAIAVKSHYVYLAVDAPPTTINISGPGLEVVEVADVDQPRLVGRVTLPSPALVTLPQSGDLSVKVTALAVSGDLVLIGSFLDGRAALGVVDVSNPAAPQVAGRFDLLGVARIARIDFQGRYAYLAETNSGLIVLDLLDPSNPVPVGGYAETLPTTSVSVRSNLCLLTGAFGTRLLDVTQPQNPVLVGSNNIAVKLDWLQNPLALASGPDSIKVYDLINIASPLQLGQFIGAYEEVLVQGRYAFAAGGAAGLTILDLGANFATPPTILDQPANTRTVAGGNASFFVGVSGNVPVTYQWQFNGADLPGETQPLLSLFNVQATAAGSYRVRVANSSGSITSVVATLSVNFPPTVALVQPSDHQTFSPPANITLTAVASDSDGSIAEVKFYQAATLLGVLTNSPFSLTVSNRPLGRYQFKAVATDDEGAVTESEIVTAVVTNLPVIQLSAANYLVNESNGVATVTLRRNGSGTASVSFFTLAGSARPSVNGGYGSYVTVSNTVTFPAGVLETNVAIPLINDLVYRGNRSFTVTLANASAGWTLAYPSNAVVTIVDDDPTATTNSFTDVVFPAAAPGALGSLEVTLLPPGAVGSWRFTWETEWRSSGDLATGLVPGEHPIEFIPRSGFVTPEITNLMVNVGFNTLTNTYATNGGAAELGALSVNLSPAEIQAGTNRGQWRLQGEFGPNWYDSGAVLPNIPVGFHIAEFKTIAGYETPASRVLSVIAGRTNYGQANYAVALPAAGAGPVVLPTFATIANGLPAGLPYAFSGQLLSDAGHGSGCVVKRHTVLTAAHVVFDSSSLSWAGNLRWFFQRYNGEYEPIPQTPRASLALSGYAAARTNDLLRGLNPGESSLESRNLDVAVLSFDDSDDDTRLPGGGGQGGYLVSDPAATDWLTTPSLKLLIGYPVEQINGADKGKMHQVGPGSLQFEAVTNQIYRSYDLKSYPGNSGGPLCVFAVNSSGLPFFIPAAVFVGGSGQTIVRAIDRDVVDLINQSEVLSAAGGNSTGGGVVQWAGDPSTAPPASWMFKVNLLPLGAFATGPGWRVSGTVGWNVDYSHWYLVTNPATANNLNIEFNDASGFIKPAAFHATVVLGQPLLISATYVPLPPAQLSVIPAVGFAPGGSTGGSFAPSSITYTLANPGGQTLNWIIGTSANWLTLSANSGTLAAGASTNITLSVNANANLLASGSYPDTVTFNNTSQGNLGSTNRPVVLTVLANAPILLSAPTVLPNGSLRLTLSGPSGKVYTIQTSSNLINWTDGVPLTNTTGTNVFTNPPASGEGKGFFRAKQQP
jgi:hypothetical protein